MGDAIGPADLARIGLFSGLADEELGLLCRQVQLRRFRRGDVVLRYGDEGTTVFLVRSGQLKVTRPLASGEEAVIAVLGPGDVFGELSLLDGRPRSASVSALAPTEALVLHRSGFLAVVRQHPDVAVAIMVVLAGRIRRLDEQVEARFLDLPQRLARELLDLGRTRGVAGPQGVQVQLPISQGDLASLAGASRPRVNRILAEWQDQRLIRLGARGEVLILQPKALAALAEG